MKSLAQIARASATIARRDCVNDVDLKLARRVALDTLPTNRAKVVRALVNDLEYEGRASKLIVSTKIPKVTFYRTVEDLVAIGAAEVYIVDENDKIISLTPEFKELAEKANL
jgi:DNA-binding MarR family transcriptional regulator